MSQYDRYREDAALLAAIGRVLREQPDPSATTLPSDLRRRALRAWQRDESEPTDVETADQARLRASAATLALIGLAVQEAGEAATISLHPDSFAEAVAAAGAT